MRRSHERRSVAIDAALERPSTRSSTATRAARGSASALDADGLLAAGVPGVQLTWMDASVGDQVITPRIGKPVEVQALWLNALGIGARVVAAMGATARARASRAFDERFWNDGRRRASTTSSTSITCAGTVDAACGPIRSSPWAASRSRFSTAIARARVVDAVERQLWTPLGLRSLAPDEPGYVGRYAGGVAARDGAYHQGTVWPWLLGPFVDAWVRVRGDTAAARTEARDAFSRAAARASRAAGLGHVSEIADGDAPHHARRLPVPGVVGRRGPAPRSCRALSRYIPGSGDTTSRAGIEPHREDIDESTDGYAGDRPRSHPIGIPRDARPETDRGTGRAVLAPRSEDSRVLLDSLVVPACCGARRMALRPRRRLADGVGHASSALHWREYLIEASASASSWCRRRS